MRFPDFSESVYSKHRFEDIFNFSTGKNIKQSEASPEFETPCVRYGELYHMYKEVIHEVINRTNLNRNDLLFSNGDEVLLPSAGEDPLDIGSASTLTIPNVAIGRTINILRPKIEALYSQIFVSYYINQKLKKKISSLAKGVSISNVYNSDLKKLSITLPPLPEQNKIAAFLSLIAERIQTQSKIIEECKLLRNYLISFYFDSEEERKSVFIGDCIRQISKRNRNGENYTVFSVSNKYGFIKQAEQFEDRVIASDNTENYKVISKNVFAYNPARINVGSIARMKEIGTGIVSPMYVCFKTNEELLLPEYFDYYFKSTTFKREMTKRLEGSVRLCLNYDGLCNIKINLSSLEKQQKISFQLYSLDQKINLETKHLDLLSKQKQYFLQNLFI